MRLKMGLQAKIIVLVICGLITIFAVFSFLALQTVDESTQRSLAERLAVASLIAAHSDEHVRESTELLTDVASPELLLQNQAGAQSRASLAKLYQPTVFLDWAVYVLDPTGNVFWSEPQGRLTTGALLPGFASFAEGLRAGQPQVSDLVVEPNTGKPIVTLTVPILDDRGHLIGALGSAGDLASDRLSMLVEPVTMGRTGYAEIVDRNGRVLASTKEDRLFQKDDHVDRFSTLLANKQPVVGRCHRCHESPAPERQNDVLAFSPMANAPWGVALRQLEDEVLAPTREMSQRSIMVAVPLFAFALAAAWLTTSRIVWPIRSLTVASKRIAEGDLDFSVVAPGHDELGALAAAFEKMRVKLKASYEEIEAWNRDLERRVEKRTRDLDAIFEASQVLSTTMDLGSRVRELVSKLVVVVRQSSAGVLYLHAADSDYLVAMSCHGYKSETLAQLRIRPGEGIAGKVLRSKQPLVWSGGSAIAAAMADLSPENAALWREATGDAVAVGSIGAPLVAQGEVIGCLVLDSFDPQQSFGEADLSLIHTIADRIAAAIENSRLYEELQRKEHLRGQLLEKVIVAQEEERKRIARELHDETGQSLTALAISLASAQEATPPGAVTVNNALAQSKALAEKLLSEIRRLISDLRPTVLDDLGLVPALRRYATTHAEMLRLDVQLRVEGRRRRLLPQMETALFRIVQEALTNVAKHARAKEVSITLVFEDRRVVVEVADNGRGFDVAQVLSSAGNESGVGLLGMRERATLLGGTLEIVSHPSEGTRLVVSMPLEREEVTVNEFADSSVAG